MGRLNFDVKSGCSNARLTWSVDMKLEFVIFHDDAPLAFEHFGHVVLSHDLPGLICHPKCDRVYLRVLQAWHADMTLYDFFLLNAKFTNTARAVELLVQNHACLLVVVIFKTDLFVFCQLLLETLSFKFEHRIVIITVHGVVILHAHEAALDIAAREHVFLLIAQL